MTPPIISRQGWGAAPAAPGTPWTSGQPTGWAVHWEGADGAGSAHDRCAANVRSIQAYHQRNGYSDIAYSYCVCRHGTVYVGRGNDVQSAAQRGGNDRLLAVCYLGGPNTPFTDEAKRAIRFVVFEQGPTAARGRAIGHRGVVGSATSCPGDQISLWVSNGLPAGPVPPKPDPVPAKHPTLRQGARGPAVMELQRKLNAVLNGNLSVDGTFGPNTTRMVKMFQQWSTDRGVGLAVDGVAGPATWRSLDRFAGQRGVR
jgi:peptidoglycan hydrolase-like protein with peptidoglycan-binding domain